MADSPTTIPEDTPSESAPVRQRIELETENLVATYDTVAEWIRFADAKAAVVLTVVGAIAGTLIPTLRGCEFFSCRV
jgi:hypothetical protein